MMSNPFGVKGTPKGFNVKARGESPGVKGDIQYPTWNIQCSIFAARCGKAEERRIGGFQDKAKIGHWLLNIKH